MVMFNITATERSQAFRLFICAMVLLVTGKVVITLHYDLPEADND